MMLDEKSQAEVNSVARTTQIIVVALCMGVLSFGLVVFFGGLADEEAEGNTITMTSVAFAVLCLGLSVVVPRAVAAANRRKIAAGTWQPSGNRGNVPDTDAGKLAATYQLKTIIGAALLEGPAFFALMAYMLEGHWLSLIAAGVLLVGLLAYFPTSDRVQSWVGEQLRLLEEQRYFSG
jgi:hypothetical protein